MEKLVIFGSSKLEDKVKYWINFFENKDMNWIGIYK